MNERILITGATGFIGSRLTQCALDRGYSVKAVSRSAEDLRKHPWANDVEIFQTEDIAHEERWPRVLQGVSMVVHLAGKAHVAEEGDPLKTRQYFETNTLGTLRLASAAARAGVSRFVFVSSIKVNGRSTPIGEAFSEQDDVHPSGAYAISKWEAERRLWRMAAATGLEVVVVRPPLVYGPGVKANMLALLKVVDKGLPLPLASIRNRRSYVGLSNLAHLLATCLEHLAAAGQTFLAGDGRDLSTPDLIRSISKALDRPCRLLPFPPALLKAAGRARPSVASALFDSLAVDADRARRTLAWSPPLSVEGGMQEMADWYLESGKAP